MRRAEETDREREGRGKREGRERERKRDRVGKERRGRGEPERVGQEERSTYDAVCDKLVSPNKSGIDLHKVLSIKIIVSLIDQGRKGNACAKMFHPGGTQKMEMSREMAIATTAAATSNNKQQTTATANNNSNRAEAYQARLPNWCMCAATANTVYDVPTGIWDKGVAHLPLWCQSE